jgi:CRP-like cAMP-binding protein
MPEPMTQLSRGWPVGPVSLRPRRMSKEELLLRQRALAAAPMFAEISKRHLRSIAKVTWVRTLPAGATLMAEGSPGSSFLVVLEGQVKVLRNGRTVARGSGGDFFGEISLLDPGPRTATVVAETPVTCIDLAGQDFRRILGNEPTLALRLLKGLAHRLREIQPALG